MKILYGASNRAGANLQLDSFLKNCSQDVRIATYVNDLITYSDWTLNAIKKYDDIIAEIADWGPDLVISDFELITAQIAEILNIELWYCSPLLLWFAFSWKDINFNYYNYRDYVWTALPEAQRYLVYSPFGDIKNPIELREKFEWITPYKHSITSNFIDINGTNLDQQRFNLWGEAYGFYFSTGETNVIASLFYEEKHGFIISNVQNHESIINGPLLEYYNLGIDVGNAEKDLAYFGRYLEQIKDFKPNKNYLDFKNYLYLHELVE